MRNIIWVILLFIFSFNNVFAQNLQNPFAPFKQYETKDKMGRKIKYYFASSNSKAPLIIMIGGSGCAPIFFKNDHDEYISTMFGAYDFAKNGDFNVLLVEKPYVLEKMTSNTGSAEQCGNDFNKDFTAYSWELAQITAINQVLVSKFVDKSKILVLGHSEGAVIAGMLAARFKPITHAALLAPSGSLQSYDFIINAYNENKSDKEKLANIIEFENNFKAIMAKPNSHSDFIWGHSYKRWASFFEIKLDEILPKSNAKIYLGFGMNDKNVPSLSSEILANKLLMAKKDITIERFENAGHNLLKEGQNYDDLAKIYEKIGQRLLEK